MAEESKFRVQAGNLLFELEGESKFVQRQLDLHKEHIRTILQEQAKLIKGGAATPASVSATAPAAPRRRGRPPKVQSAPPTSATAPKAAAPAAQAKPGRGRRPGRQPVIIRQSSLDLKPRQLSHLESYLAGLAGKNKLGKDATVFAIAYFLCTQVLNSDTFTAGDISVAYSKLGKPAYAPPAKSVDVVQMLRNLAAASIGKEWVARNADGTFTLTSKGREVGASGNIVRPRGRRPGSGAGRPAKLARKATGRRRGRPPKAAAQPAKVPGRRRGRPPKYPR